MSFEKNDKFRALKDTLSGSTAGMGVVLAGYPFDTIKVKMQTLGGNTSILNTIKTTFKSQGPRGFYVGMLSPMIGTTILNSYSFFVFNFLGRRLYGEKDFNKLSIPQIMSFSSITGVFLSFVETPFDLVKCKLQNGKIRAGKVGLSKKYGTIQCARDIFRQYGFKGLYQGYLPTLFRNVPCSTLYFTSYHASRRFFRKRRIKNNKSPKLSQIETFISGSIAGFSYWGICFPLDVIKSKMQADHSSKNLREFPSYLSAVKHIYKENGYKGFFQGYTPCVIRALVACAFQLQCYEFAQSTLDKLF